MIAVIIGGITIIPIVVYGRLMGSLFSIPVPGKLYCIPGIISFTVRYANKIFNTFKKIKTKKLIIEIALKLFRFKKEITFSKFKMMVS